MTIKTDVVIVGAGPCGLFQVFELGLLDIKAHVVDSLPEIGGQCAFLYPEKPIYDIPALPVVGAQELVDRLAKQIEPFGAEFHLGHEVTELERREDGTFRLRTAKGLELDTRTVVIAGGLGSFQPRPLRVPGAKKHEGGALDYKVTDKERYRGKRVVILGGGDSALDWALELHAVGAAVTLVHRREEFRAQPASVARLQALAESDPERMAWRVGRIAGLVEDGEALVGIKVGAFGDDDGPVDELPLDALLVFYGLSPNLGPIAEWGLEIERRQIPVDTEKFQTSIPGIFAVGDINTYPGKKKLILSGFHEAALAAFGIQKHLDPNARQFLQYTTTSPVMHERLKVSGTVEGAAEGAGD
ncbi:MAG: NAD(P)/FAD-dependent oxidoreductase [Ectothiorhodospiraceae bacterium]|nr:NAD(P)/FAD-dependent oxidoreductase [Ectothiorhodospiraceae bacterium]